MTEYKVGDWVRFYRGGSFVIGRVDYIVNRTGGYVYLLTDIGEVRVDDVVESKR